MAEAIKGHTQRLVSVGGEAVFKGWLKVTDPNMFQTQEPSPIPVPEEGFLEDLGVDHFVDRMLETERLIMQAHKEGHYNVTHFRYAMGYGPRHLAPPDWSIIRRILEGRKQFILPNGGQVIVCKGYGENEAHALLLAIDNPDASAGQIYNISDETKMTNREWVRAVASVMNQSYSDWRCWVVEDGETIETRNQVKDFLEDKRFKYVTGKHIGTPSGPRNRGIESGQAEYIAFLDDDDIGLPEKLERQINLFNKRIRPLFEMILWPARTVIDWYNAADILKSGGDVN